MHMTKAHRAVIFIRHVTIGIRSFLAVLFAAAVLIVASAPEAPAFWITQSGGESVNGSPITGCADVNGASTTQHTAVGFYPCSANTNEQWTMSGNGLIGGIGKNCLTINASAKAEMDTCNSNSNADIWSTGAYPIFGINNPGALITAANGGVSTCLQSGGAIGSGKQLSAAFSGCSSNVSTWSLSGGFWITQAGGGSANGSPMTGCADVEGASTAQNAPVGFFPCTANANEKWTYANGEIVGLGGNCLTVSSTATIVMQTCSTDAPNQQWSFSYSNWTWVHIANYNGGCLNSSGKAGANQQLTVTYACYSNTPATAGWSVAN